jgi:hypothetical protein
MELSGTTRQVPSLYLTTFSSFVSFRKIDWHASDPACVLSQLHFVLLRALSGVLILRQHTFWHAWWDI